MPELPEVHTIANDLNNNIVGYEIKSIKIAKDYKVPELVKKKLLTLLNKKFIEVRRIAKNIVIKLSEDDFLTFHLAMTGRILLTSDKDKKDNWVAIEEALEGPGGDKLWAPIRANFHSTGAAVIPATCSDPELVLRWLDYFRTDEGTLFYHMGVENETFVAKEDGTYDYVPAIYDEMAAENATFDETVAKFSPYPGGGNPMVEVAPYFRGGEMAPVPAATARALFPYGPQEYWPAFTFTAEETETLNALTSDIEKFCTDSRIAWGRSDPASVICATAPVPCCSQLSRVPASGAPPPAPAVP